MASERELLDELKKLIGVKQYRVRIHAVRHMIEEGFSEQNIVEAVIGKSKILENYTEESRCLILGHFTIGQRARTPLHIVCDYSNGQVVDIVTAYCPQKPWWISPTKRGRVV